MRSILLALCLVVSCLVSVPASADHSAGSCSGGSCSGVSRGRMGDFPRLVLVRRDSAGRFRGFRPLQSIRPIRGLFRGCGG